MKAQLSTKPKTHLSIATGFNNWETFKHPFLSPSAAPTAEPNVPVVSANRLPATLRPGWKNDTSIFSLVSPFSALGADPLLSEGPPLLHMHVPDASWTCSWAWWALPGLGWTIPDAPHVRQSTWAGRVRGSPQHPPGMAGSKTPCPRVKHAGVGTWLQPLHHTVIKQERFQSAAPLSKDESASPNRLRSPQQLAAEPTNALTNSPH